MSIPQLISWLCFKASMGLGLPLAVMANLQATSLSEENVSPVIPWVWAALSVGGALVSVAGLLMQFAGRPRARTMGLSVELAGLAFMFTGPLVLLISYTYAAMGNPTRWAAVCLAAGLASALAARFFTVLPHWRFEATTPEKG